VCWDRNGRSLAGDLSWVRGRSKRNRKTWDERHQTGDEADKAGGAAYGLLDHLQDGELRTEKDRPRRGLCAVFWVLSVCRVGTVSNQIKLLTRDPNLGSAWEMDSPKNNTWFCSLWWSPYHQLHTRKTMKYQERNRKYDYTQGWKKKIRKGLQNLAITK
jgi:hypothetical protein